MANTNQDWTVYQGNDTTGTFTVTDSAGDAINLTGATIHWRAKHRHLSGVTLSKTTGSGIASATPSSGIFVVTLTDADTLCFGEYLHEALVVDSGGNRTTVSLGSLFIERSIVNVAG